MGIDYKLIGARIKGVRNMRGFTQEQLAEKLDVSVGYVSQVERGITKISLDLLGSVSAVLGCDICELVSESAPQSNGYMNAALESRFARLTDKEKRLVAAVMDEIIVNR